MKEASRQMVSRRHDVVDLRSDTVTKPVPEMREAMARAPVGDDVYGEDPTVMELEERGAAMFGKERALFVPSGVMANQLALKISTQPGDEVIVGEMSHLFHYETGAPAVLSGVQLHTVPDHDGRIELEAIEGAIRESVYYMPQTSVIAQENTHNKTSGKTTSIDHHRALFEYSRDRNLRVHLDGARLWNASVATGTSLREYGDVCDTLSVCLSKGLGAPVGSLLIADGSDIDRAWHFRKMWGGGWRQAGILAAAGLWALDHHIDRLAEDHEKARSFHELISESEFIDAGTPPDSNIVIFRIPEHQIDEMVHAAAEEGILLSAAFRGALRAVFHLDVTVDGAVRAGEFVASWPNGGR